MQSVIFCKGLVLWPSSWDTLNQVWLGAQIGTYCPVSLLKITERFAWEAVVKDVVLAVTWDREMISLAISTYEGTKIHQNTQTFQNIVSKIGIGIELGIGIVIVYTNTNGIQNTHSMIAEFGSIKKITPNYHAKFRPHLQWDWLSRTLHKCFIKVLFLEMVLGFLYTCLYMVDDFINLLYQNYCCLGFCCSGIVRSLQHFLIGLVCSVYLPLLLFHSFSSLQYFRFIFFGNVFHI